MSTALGLYRLQQIDRQVDHARAQLDTIRRTLENDSEMRQATLEFEQADAEVQRTKTALRKCEAEVESQRIKIEQSEASLYGGKVQNPKELQDLQKDIVSLKKYLLTLEERELQAMFQLEEQDDLLRAATTRLELIQARLKSENKKLINDQSEWNIRLAELAEERTASLAMLPTDLLQVYENLRQQKRGVAVAEVSDNACSLCGAPVSAALQQSARSQKQMAYCPTCGRILFAR